MDILVMECQEQEVTCILYYFGGSAKKIFFKKCSINFKLDGECGSYTYALSIVVANCCYHAYMHEAELCYRVVSTCRYNVCQI